MDLDAFVGLREINPVIFRTIPIQFFSLALDDAEPSRAELIQILGQYLKLGQQLELQFLRQRRDLGRAQFVEDDLEHDFGYGEGRPTQTLAAPVRQSG